MVEIMDVIFEEVEKVMQKYNVVRLIYGYIYCFNIYLFIVNNKFVYCIVLGDWYIQGSVLCVSVVDVSLEKCQFN